MTAPETRAVLDALGGEGRFVGGAVRNALLGKPVADVDIATPLLPEEVSKRLTAAHLGAVPTGIDHGTVTAIANGKPYEVTTLRRDVSTDGRRATVAFTTDWAEDAQRRDFTMNALYASADGRVLDTVGGVEDLKAGRVRFVGDPTTRIREDYLRILRLFRFHAWYGKGEMDSAALHAAAAERAGLAQLSGERIQKELLRLLEADQPSRVLRIMAATGILSALLPGELNIARLESLEEIDANNFFAPDSVLRLAALLPDDIAVAQAVAHKLRLSNKDAIRLEDIAGAREKIVSYMSVKEQRKMLYRIGIPRFRDRVFIKWAEDPKASNAVNWRMLLEVAATWPRPRFPLTGRDVMLAGVPQGPLIGRILEEVEDWWVDADFIEDEFSLAERLKAVVQATAY
ncbi:MAG: CCA tRNA nucleotidyltransferase [Alphaproteobacteria bacterium]|nr:CCA tRNA nucleotidyltransferase [Alphaproteobacteria bacterium]MBL7098040.1 CCA tRNA nucleotidyltransferase [Alphaproteobacteria bacterium]